MLEAKRSSVDWVEAWVKGMAWQKVRSRVVGSRLELAWRVEVEKKEGCLLWWAMVKGKVYLVVVKGWVKGMGLGKVRLRVELSRGKCA